MQPKPSHRKLPVEPSGETSALTGSQSRHSRREYESYLVAACGIALIVLLVVGTAAFAAIHALLYPAVAAISSRAIVLLDNVAPDSLLGLDAIILTMIGLLAVVASTPPRRNPTAERNR